MLLKYILRINAYAFILSYSRTSSSAAQNYLTRVFPRARILRNKSQFGEKCAIQVLPTKKSLTAGEGHNSIQLRTSFLANHTPRRPFFFNARRKCGRSSGQAGVDERKGHGIRISGG